jgi:hypothetical protein
MIEYLVCFRDFFVNIFYGHLIGIVDENNKLVTTNKFLSFFPIKLISLFLDYYNLVYYYQKDELIYYSKQNELTISPIILSTKVKRGDIIIDLSNNLSVYQNNLPFWILLYNENKLHFDKLIKKIIKNGRFQETEHDIKDLLDLKCNQVWDL